MIETIEFATGKKAIVLLGEQDTPAAAILTALALPRPRALLILNGGTATLEEPLLGQLQRTLQDGLARVVAAEQITVITGGTDAGVFQLFGQGLAQYGRTAPCIGVAVETLVTWPGKAQGEATLEANHSHFVLVSGKSWGDETTTLYALAAALGKACPSVAVFASGGEITIHEMQANVVQGRPMVLLAGSGRATDAVLAARAGQSADDPRVNQIAQKGRILAFALSAEPSALDNLLRRLLAIDRA